MAAASPEIIETYRTLGEKYQDYVKQYTVIKQSNLDDLLEKVPVHHAFFGGVYAYACTVYETNVANLESLRADIAKNARTQLLTEGSKATVAAVNELVDSNPTIAAQLGLVQDSQYKMLLAKQLLKSLECAKDMLIQISANRRNESKLI